MSSRESFYVKCILEGRIKKSPTQYAIYLRIIMGRQKSEISLHAFADPVRWDKISGRIMRPNQYETHLNAMLSEAEQRVNEIRWELQREGTEVSPRLITAIFKNGKQVDSPRMLDFFRAIIDELRAKNELSPSVLNHYNQAYLKLTAYLKKNKLEHLLVREFSLKHIDGFEVFMLTTSSDVIGKPISRNSASNHLKKLKSVLNHALVKEVITKNPFFGFKIRTVEAKRIALTQGEIEALRLYKFDNESLAKCRDVLLWSVYTGLRYSDAMALKTENIIQDRSGRMFISGIQKKTGQPFEVVMIKQAEEIYNRYEPYRLLTNYVLPRISNSKVNAYLKEVGKFVGINKPLSHHIGRHSFCVMLNEMGIDTFTISKMMGHSSTKATTSTYSKATHKVLLSAADRMESQLL